MIFEGLRSAPKPIFHLRTQEMRQNERLRGADASRKSNRNGGVDALLKEIQCWPMIAMVGGGWWVVGGG